MAARRHHFISQCYLKRFTRNGSKNSKLWAYDIPSGKTFETMPANVAHQRDFNRVDICGHLPDALESSLAKFESQADSALHKIADTQSLDDFDSWVTILNLVALFAVRNPRMREMMRDSQERLANIIMDVTLAKKERWELQLKRAIASGDIELDSGVSYEDVKEFHNRGEYTIEVPTMRHIRTEFHVYEPVLRTMVDRKWQLCIAAPDSGGYVTTDHPVCLIHSDGEPQSLVRPLGYGLKGTTVVFPVTRELLAIGTFEGDGGVQTLTRNQVAYFNTIVMNFADRQVYAPNGRFYFAPNGLGAPLVQGGDVGRHVRPPATEKETATRKQF